MEKVKQNGLITTDAPARANDRNKQQLSPAQQKYFQRLINILRGAEIEQEAAQEAKTLAQGNAEEFVGFCAQELGLPLGTDGWRFDQPSLSFVREEPLGNDS